MHTLDRSLRGDLKTCIEKARRLAEVGALDALTALGVEDKDAPAHLTAERQALRKRLRAHARQLGDKRDSAAGTQAVGRLKGEIAYAHWHRMLFARFLAENDLLIEPTSGLAITLDDVKELAAGGDWLDLASDYAVRMLPQIFAKDNPALALALPVNVRSDLEDLLKALPAAVFKADDSLGWVYQFWQAEQKKRINDSRVKIGADELPAVTQLFTEDYMVLFLLHNTLGAWWAGKVLVANPTLAATAADEDELRAACAPDGIAWTYLRFVRDTGEDGTQGPWRPAAGTFEGWPKAARDITLLDPCMGSGHFLVFALPILVAFRMAEEGLSREAAVEAVLRDNIHGLEIDPRCTQIAAFNLAFAAWRMVGYRPLPPLHLACSGLAIGVTKTEWLRLGERAAALADPGAKSDLLGTETTLLNGGVDARVRTGLERMYDLFAKAPWLGSLIDPRRAGADIFAADFDALEPFLKRALADGSEELAEMAVAAQGLAKAAELLAKQYVLVATNVPYLGRGQMTREIRDYCDENFPSSREDAGIVFFEKYVLHKGNALSIAFVVPTSFQSLRSYREFRYKVLSRMRMNAIVRVGAGSFETITGQVVNVSLVIGENAAPNQIRWIDCFGVKMILDKVEYIADGNMNTVSQAVYGKIRDYVLSPSPSLGDKLLADYVEAYEGTSRGDSEKYDRAFWEMARIAGESWSFMLNSPSDERFWSGRETVIRWESGSGELASSPEARIRGRELWGSSGIAVARTSNLKTTLGSGEIYAQNILLVRPAMASNFSAVWCFLTDGNFKSSLRKINQKPLIPSALVKSMPFDLAHWQKVAAEKYPNGLPKPHSDDPTQWLFNGHPKGAEQPLQVAVARLLGYRWPRQTGSSFMDCPAITEPDGLEGHADADGIVCLTAVKGEAPAEARLNALLAAAYGADWSAARLSTLLDGVGFGGKSLDDWLRDGFFEQHCALFHQRPFVWHVWDGRRDGFHALVNYHRLAGPEGEGKRTLEKLIYSYLGDWIDSQRDAQKKGVEGADGRLAAAEHLKAELEKILAGEPPYDIFVRWKPLHRQPIGWEPDINDGVRLNIRPFLTARPLTTAKRGDPCILRVRPKGSEFNYMGKPDRGKEPVRDKADYPWFWGWTPENPDLATDFPGGADFDGNRWNGLHYSVSLKRAARARHSAPGETP
ncbi:MAG: hypothetical protein RLY86_1131 [Pseudomonadota bacterium]|jgi:hypothetical protein